MPTETLTLGQEVLYRLDRQSRKWKRGFLVGVRKNWLIVRLRDGIEIELHPLDVKAP